MMNQTMTHSITQANPVARMQMNSVVYAPSSSIKKATRQTISIRQRRRLARSIFSLSLLIVIGAGFSAFSSGSSHASESHVNNATNGFVRVVVSNGESLWKIASIINPNDPTSVVDQIVTANNLQGADVSSGESIWVPTK